jgi:hypothetical protein
MSSSSSLAPVPSPPSTTAPPPILDDDSELGILLLKGFYYAATHSHRTDFPKVVTEAKMIVDIADAIVFKNKKLDADKRKVIMNRVSLFIRQYRYGCATGEIWCDRKNSESQIVIVAMVEKRWDNHTINYISEFPEDDDEAPCIEEMDIIDLVRRYRFLVAMPRDDDNN